MNLYAKLTPEMRPKWYSTAPEAIEDFFCCDCGAPAEKITDAGYSPRGETIHWAHCRDCAYESRAESIEAARQ